MAKKHRPKDCSTEINIYVICRRAFLLIRRSYAELGWFGFVFYIQVHERLLA